MKVEELTRENIVLQRAKWLCFAVYGNSHADRLRLPESLDEYWDYATENRSEEAAEFIESARLTIEADESLGLVLMPREPTQDMWTFLDDEYPAAVDVFQAQLNGNPND